MKNRSRTDLIGSILEAIVRGRSTKTKIMYGAYLSYTQLNEYMSFLLEAGLVEDQKSKQDLFSPSFVITEKGKHFLDIQNKINEMVTVVQSG
jgi:predicted transcriptional regulator